MADEINYQQTLRRWARDNADPQEPVTLSAEEAKIMATGIAGLLGVIDGIYAKLRRPLTHFEKFGIEP